jgi:transposase
MLDVIQAPKPGSNHALRTHRLRMDGHQVDAAEQAARRATVNDRRVLQGIFWVLRSGAPWRDLPDSVGPYTDFFAAEKAVADQPLGVSTA